MKRGYLAAILMMLTAAGSAVADGQPDGSMRTWLYGDYLLWWLRSAPSGGPLLTTGNLTNPTSVGSGILGAPGTQVLSGDSLNTGPYSGFRVGAGWINCGNSIGVDGNFFYLTQHGAQETFGSDTGGNPLLARPVIDARTGNETVFFVSAPNAFAGTFEADSATRLYGYDVNVLLPWYSCDACDPDELGYYLTPLAGYRYLNLHDDLTLRQSTNVLANGVTFINEQPLVQGSVLKVTDNFSTLNQFYGGQIGLRGGLNWWRFRLYGTAKVALGSMREEASAGGSTTGYNSLLGNIQTVPGGVLALATNSSAYNRNIITVIPEGTLNFGVEITSQIQLTVGYTILYVSNVERAGNVIDRSVNRTLVPSSQSYNPTVPGPAHPSFNWNATDFWAQGINIGLVLRF